MKLTFLINQKSNSKLILIFAGWNTDADFYRYIKPREGWDLAVATGLAELETMSLPANYHTVYLYAWSFGVKAASLVLSPSQITEAFAISGTVPGIGEFGIPTEIFNATKQTLSLSSLAKFRNRIFSAQSREERNLLMSRLPVDPSIDQLRNELEAIATSDPELPASAGLPWRNAYIGLQDRIFPPQAQKTAWLSLPHPPRIIESQDGHYMDLERIILQTTPDTEQTAISFSKSAGTYNRNATSQTYFAGKLASALQSLVPRQHTRGFSGVERILEIGNGSGVFSHMLAQLFPEAEVTFVDIAEVTPYSLFGNETYVKADAEAWMESHTGEYDLIASASAIQWFSNPRTFFRNARRLLREGGLMACSIYSQGNLPELTPLRPSPVHYHTAEELAAMAKIYFPDSEWEEEHYTLSFPTPREALMHLRQTGVSPRTGTSIRLGSLLKALSQSRLTYRATRISAIK